MSFISDILNKLSKKLYPSGRAFRIFPNSVKSQLEEGLNLSFERFLVDSKGLLQDILADNDDFTEEDCSRWERRLGLINSQGVPIADRKAAILRKYNHPGHIKPRQHWRYIQDQLQKAGFDVYVFENRFPDGLGGFFTKTPEEFAVSPIGDVIQHGDIEHGDRQHGGRNLEKIVNSLDPNVDAVFDIGDSFNNTFFISSEDPGVNALVPENRYEEFRKLVLTLKPAQTVVFPFVSTSEVIPSYILLEDGANILIEDDNKTLLEDAYS